MLLFFGLFGFYRVDFLFDLDSGSARSNDKSRSAYIEEYLSDTEVFTSCQTVLANGIDISGMDGRDIEAYLVSSSGKDC